MVYPRKMSVIVIFFFFQNVYGRASIIIEPSSNLFTAKLFWSTFSRIWIEYGEREEERERVSLRSQSECGKMGARITPNMDTSYAVILVPVCCLEHVLQVNKYSIFLQEHFRFSILIK